MRRALHLVLICGCAVLALASPAGAEPLDPARLAALSDERKLSRWAHPLAQAPVRRNPTGESRTVTRLRFDTEDGLSEVYLALRSYRHPDGSEWVEVRLPRRPNGQTGWVRREALGRWHVVRTSLHIDRRRMRATLYRSGRRVWSAPVGVGKPSTPTPAGSFYIRGHLTPPRGTIYGASAYATSAYASVSDWPGGGVVGIHGTDRPDLIPGRPSSGCVRVRARDLARLDRLLENGTPVRIV